MMLEIKDQAGRRVLLKAYPPKRIVSLVPSVTELLHDLGLEEEVVGITKFCVHPKSWFRKKARVGGTKNVHFDAVRLLQPDLVLANKEENIREQVEALESIAPVWVSDVNTYEDALSMIAAVGELTDKKERASALATEIKAAFNMLPEGNSWGSACYLIWREPYMTAGGDTFISDMLQKAGFVNVFKLEMRYPQITLQQIAERKPQFVFLSSEPYPFKEKHIAAMKTALPNSMVLLADGEMFSWYGSRMRYAAPYFLELREKIFRLSSGGERGFC